MIDHGRIDVAHDINTESYQESLEQVDDFCREQKAWAPIKSGIMKRIMIIGIDVVVLNG